MFISMLSLKIINELMPAYCLVKKTNIFLFFFLRWWYNIATKKLFKTLIEGY